MADIPLTPGVLPDPYTCWQDLYAQMFSLGKGTAPDVAGILVQDAPPDPADRGVKGWIPTSGGVPIYPGYVFWWHPVLGHWVSRHPIAASDPSLRIYTGALASLDTYDNGDANPPGVASGPMWEVETTMEGRVPVGQGTIPGTAPAVTIAQGATQDSNAVSGEYAHILAESEGGLGSHTHPVGLFNASGGGNADDAFFNWVNPAVATSNWTGKYITGGDGVVTAAQTTADIYTLPPDNGSGVTSDAHNNMQPYKGVAFIKRTARQWIVAI